MSFSPTPLIKKSFLIVVFFTSFLLAATYSPSAAEILNKRIRKVNWLEKEAALAETQLAIIQQFSLTASDPGTFDEFGWDVAIDGDIAVVGARDADLNIGGETLANTGAAYVFVYNGRNWFQEAKLVAKDASEGDTFGAAVSISRGVILIGAPGVEVDEEEDAGAAYVFVRQGNTWKQQAKLTASDALEEDTFGTAVALHNNIAVVGAEGKDLSVLPDVGAVYIFRRSGQSWAQKAKLLPTDPELGDSFGASVAYDGNKMVVGATELNPLENVGSGEVFVFTQSGGSWIPHSKILAEDGRNGDGFGRSVAISNDRIVVGALFKDPELENGRLLNAGGAYVYVYGGSKWKEEAVLVPDDAANFDHFGQSVDIYGRTIVVGAEGKTQAGNSDAGAAYIYQRVLGVWEQQTKAVTDPAFEDDAFGKAVAIYGDWVVAGANGRDPFGFSRAGEAFMIHLGETLLPDTGFAPGQITALPIQPLEKAYQHMGELWVEVPALGVQTQIVGVSRGGNGWDVRWLWDRAGYMEGTAFPTWQGNTGIAAHTTLPNGQPGPFAELYKLQYGDEIIIHAWGQRYIYEVRESSLVTPTNMSVLEHKDLDWVTLISCQGFDETEGNYRWRRAIQAVLTKVEAE